MSLQESLDRWRAAHPEEIVAGKVTSIKEYRILSADTPTMSYTVKLQGETKPRLIEYVYNSKTPEKYDKARAIKPGDTVQIGKARNFCDSRKNDYRIIL